LFAPILELAYKANANTRGYLRVGSTFLSSFSECLLQGWYNTVGRISNADEKGEHHMASSKKPDAPGMKGYRTRDEDGELRQKRSDTHARTIEEKYDVDFKVRDDMHLGTLLERAGVDSLDELLRKQ